MAVAVNVTADDHVFIGSVKDLEFAVYTDENATEAIDADGWTLRFDVRLTDRSDEVLISKESGSPVEIEVTGTFDSDPADNTQRIVVHLFADDTYRADLSPPEVLVRPNIYRYALKRTDPGNETELAFGELELLQSAVR